MFTTRLEVDKHVENNIKKINNERERNLRGYAFAKLYYKVGDYESARRYVSAYLHVKPTAEAFNLLGRTLEKQEKYDSALEAFRRSFELDPKQNNLLIKICELLALENTNFDLTGARYYCERAQKIDPKNPVLYSLKEKIIKQESDNPNDITQLYLSEIETQPNNMVSRIKLLRHLLEYDKINEAYKHVFELEHKNLAVFANSLSWYEVSAEVLLKYQRNSLANTLTWEFWLLLVTILDKISALTLDEHFTSTKSSTDCITCVYNFDQTLFLLEEKLKDCPERFLVQECIKHYKGQLAFYLATLIFKRAKKDLISYKEAAQITLPLIFVAFHTEPPDLQGIWLNHTEDNRYRRLVQRWNVEGSYRCSQAGHMLVSAAKDKKHLILEKTQQFCSGLWRLQIFKKIFITRDQQGKIKTSFFANNAIFSEIELLLPNKENILKYDQVAQLLYPSSLHHLIWIGLNTVLESLDCSIFDGLPYSVKHLESSSAESLSLLDIQAFFYASVYCSHSQIKEAKKNMIIPQKNKPETFPASLTRTLGTINQHKWFKIAYQMYKKELSHNLVEIRTILVRGLEVVRCVGNHGLDAKLLIKLARIFAERAEEDCSKRSEVEANNARAELYWKTALNILEKMKKNQAVIFGKDRLFEYKGRTMTPEEVISAIDEGKLFLALRLINLNDYDKALSILENLKDPYASYHQGEVYIKMAEELQTAQNKQNFTAEMRNQYVILLVRARDSFYLTLDRLRDPSVDQQHPLNAQLGQDIEKIEKLLSKFDWDVNNGFRESPHENHQLFVGSSGDNNNSTLLLSTTNGNMFTPKKDHHQNSLYLTPRLESSFRSEARPSPERLDAQLRQMQAMRDNAFAQILEQNRIMVDSLKDAIKTTVDELKSVRTSVNELKDIKISLNELKDAVDELQNFRNVSDMVQEMKKEIAELKSSSSSKPKNSQLSEEDLYVLDEEYGSDYNAAINANLSSLNQGLYQNRGQAVNPLPYALYPGMYPPPLYPFPGLAGLPPPFGQEVQVPDFRGLSQTLVAQNPTHPTLYGQQPLSQTGGLGQSVLGQPLSAQTINPSTGFSTNFNAQTAVVGGQLGQTLAQLNPTLNAQLPFAQLNHLGQQTGLTTAPLVQSNLFKDIPSSMSLPPAAAVGGLSTSYVTPSSNTVSVPSTSKAPPVNVVITSSDPLPKTAVPTTQILSVTIPPQHLKGNLPPKTQQQQPHGYQIPVTTSTSLQSIFSQSLFGTSSITAPSSTVFSTTSSASPLTTTTVTEEKKNTQILDNSNASNSSIDEHDPCPNFKPLIPLPDEVPLNTGEENELELFCHRAKLFRFDNKEWKERGIGKIKILKDKNTGKVRVLMRREQVHKICANHLINKDMTLTSMPNSDRTYMWVANDFADEKVVLEKLCVRFKTTAEAKEFFEAFEKAKAEIKEEDDVAKPKKDTSVSASTHNQTPLSSALGGFVFTSTPTFKLREDNVTVTPTPSPAQKDTPKATPFASFTFTKNTSSAGGGSLNFTSPSHAKNEENTKKESQGDDDFKPTTEFTPVVPLPDLVEVKTGEEGSEVLYQGRAKLLRFDGKKKEWKERGVGEMKILKDKTIRLVMRREQVHKVCCNHQLLKTTKFTKMNPRAFSWYAMDFSEGVLEPEMFAIRFKAEDQAEEFFKAIQSAQQILDDDNSVIGEKKEESTKESLSSSRDEKKIKSTPAESTSEHAAKQQGWGDKFKPKSGSWECKTCYIVNDLKSSFCVACDTPKSGTTPKKNDTGESGPQFSFGMPPANGVFTFSQKPVVSTSTNAQVSSTSTWGDAFKPKEGSWDCSACLVRNDADKLYCVACETPKDDSVPKKDPLKETKTEEIKFTFGIPPATSTITSSSSSQVTTAISNQQFSFWGDSFNPKEGSSGSSKEDAVTPKEDIPKETVAESKQFSFGIPPSTSSGSPLTFGTTTTSVLPAAPTTNVFSSNTFSFLPKEATTSNNTTPTSSFNFTLTKPATATKEHEESKDNFVFGSPQKYTFEFTPRSPRRQSSGPGDEESDSYVEDEGDQIYFKPVIPLPDKIEVKTGEENEEVLYCHRAKLFRFVEGEWKERGVGDLKILYQPDCGKLRVLMRRDQVLKICLNHWLTSTIEYVPKDDKTWLFSAPDFSEGELNHWQFCLRFKNQEVAKKFKEAVDKALKKDGVVVSPGKQKSTIEKKEPQKSSENNVNENDSDVEVVWETVVSPEDEREALRLGLPPKFMAYKQLPDCTCDICKKDDQLYGDFFKIGAKATVEGDHLKKTDKEEEVSKTSKGVITAPKFVFGQPTTTVSTTFSFGSSSTIAKTPETLKSVLAKPSLLESVANKTETASPLSTFTFTLTPSNPGLNTTPKTEGPFSSTSSSSPFSFQSATNTNSFSTSTTSIFQAATTTPSSASIFGSTSSVFGKFGSNGSSGNLFDNITPQKTNTPPKLDDEKKEEGNREFFKVDPGLSFSSLAAASSQTIGQQNETPDGGNGAGTQQPFAFLGAGTPVFSSLSKSTPNKPTETDKSVNESVNNEEPAEAEDAEEEYDPHYEPIVPLPEQIVVSTGEEEETVKFDERAKLYRFDTTTKEWKERGVGNIKLLHHAEKGTYRLLLRREQVHKVVLNMLVTATLDLQPLSVSDKAWMWCGYNFTEDGSHLEKLAVRFKKEESALQFKKSVAEALEALKTEKVSTTVPSTVQNFRQNLTNQSTEEEAEDREDTDVDDEEEEEDDDDDDVDDDDERPIMFKRHCSLSEAPLESEEWKGIGSGDLEVYYDSEIYGARICMTSDDRKILTSTIIALNTTIEQNYNSCTWKAVECALTTPYRRKLKATFSTENEAIEFHAIYMEGVQYAQATDIYDDVYLEHLENKEN